MKIFPDLARQDEIKFLFFKSLPYNTRAGLIVCGMVVGLLGQLFFSFWLGWFVLAVASAMSLVHGYDSTPVAKKDPEKWDRVTPDEYAKIKSKQKDLARWDLDAFDITNPLGGTVFAVLAIVFGVIWMALLFESEELAGFWFWDGLILLAPHWVTGVRRYLRQNQLLIKIDLLGKIMEALTSPSDIQVLPMLATRATQEGKRFPTDARLMLRLVGAPDTFLGIQVQVAINSVQGTDYPYLYCVLLARSEARSFAQVRNVIQNIPEFRSSGLTVEPTSEQGVDVLVIRQTTTQTSGYCTNPRQAFMVVNFAANLARRLCNIGQSAVDSRRR